MSGNEKETLKARKFILLIVLVVAGIHVLWLISEVVARKAQETPAQARPEVVITRIKYELGLAADSIETGEIDEAIVYIERVEDYARALEDVTLSAAERYEYREAMKVADKLRQQVKAAREGVSTDGRHNK